MEIKKNIVYGKSPLCFDQKTFNFKITQDVKEETITKNTIYSENHNLPDILGYPI